MNVIKESIKVLIIDWKRIVKNPFALIIIVGLMIIPSMYAWFNIEALWDPYGNASNLPIAIYSGDEGVTLEGHELNIGDGVIEEIKKNDELAWQFPDSNSEMIEGVKSGEYYGSIYLPADFSQKLTGIVKGEYDKPELEYRVNEKINAIAPKMTEAGLEGLEGSITEGFNKVVSDVTLSVLNEAGIELDSRIPLLNKVAYSLHAINGKQDDINQVLNQVTTSKQTLLEFQRAVDNADVDSLEAAGDDAVAVISEVNDQMPGLLELQPLITSLDQNSNLITDFTKMVNTLNNDIDSVSEDLDTILTNTDNMITVLDQTLAVVSDADKYGDDINQMLADIKATSEQAGPVIDQISLSADASIKLINLIASDIESGASSLSDFVSSNALSDDQIEQIKQILGDMSANLDNLGTLIDNVIAILKPLNIVNGGSFSDIISSLQSIRSVVTATKTEVDNLINNIGSLSNDQLVAQIDQIVEDASSIASLTSGLSTAEINSQIQSTLEQISQNASSGSALVSEIGNIDANTFITSIQDNLEIVQGYVENLQTQLPSIQSYVSQLAEFMNDNEQSMITAIANLNQFWQTDLPQISEQVNNVDTYLDDNWASIKSTIDTSYATVDSQLPKVIEIVDEVAEFQTNKWPELSQFISAADQQMTDLTSNKKLEKVVDLLVNDVEQGSDFISAPVSVDTVRMYPSENYGSASSPFYTALCLWVGALLLSSLLATGFKPTSDFTPSIRGEYLGRFFTYLSIGIVQALIVSIGDLVLIGIHPVSPVYFIGFALVIEVCFMAIIYTLASLFGNIGKALAIIGLVLSISGGGGNFPIEVSANFFQTIYPFLPFTHGVNLLREAIGGIYPPTVYHAILVLIAFTIGSLGLGLFGCKFIKPYVEKFEEKCDESHIIH